MARGWESKSVESQIEDAAAARDHAPPINSAQAEKLRERELLELSRKRLTVELESSRDERLRELKRKALTYIEQKLRNSDTH
jgi:hypothetical protein